MPPPEGLSTPTPEDQGHQERVFAKQGDAQYGNTKEINLAGPNAEYADVIKKIQALETQLKKGNEVAAKITDPKAKEIAIDFGRKNQIEIDTLTKRKLDLEKRIEQLGGDHRTLQ